MMKLASDSLFTIININKKTLTHLVSELEFKLAPTSYFYSQFNYSIIIREYRTGREKWIY